jgi:hypothetical protein
MKKIRGDKQVGVMTHKYMEISQGISLCSYLYLKQAKVSDFSFFLLFLQNQRTGEWNRSCGVGRKGECRHQWGSDRERG